MVVDYQWRKLYWADNVSRVIQRSNLDGSNVENFVTASDVGNPDFDIRGLTIVYNQKPIPTLSQWSLFTMAIVVSAAGCL